MDSQDAQPVIPTANNATNNDLKKSIRPLVMNGLWHQNPALVQLLGLCPLLAVSTNLTTGLGLAVSTLAILMISSGIISIFRASIAQHLRLPIFVIILATACLCVEQLLQAFDYALYQSIGVFMPLIITNCTLLARADHFASRNSLFNALIDAGVMGLGFGAVLVCLSAIREILGQGTLLNQTIAWPESIHFTLALLPPGAFFLTACLIALKQSIDQYQETLKE